MNYLDIAKKILEVSNTELNSISTTYASEYDHLIDHNTFYFHDESGREHYRLLIYISSLFNNETIFDIGTNRCMSAIALSNNKNNKIKSFDIIQ